MKTAIVWFRNDLRLHDNETLNKAIQNAASIVPVYCIDANQFKIIDPDIPKTDSYRASFLFESLKELNESLQKIGSGLIVKVGKPEDILPAICKEYAASTIYASKEVTSEEVKAEKGVEENILRFGAELNLTWQSTLYHLDDLPFPVKALPDIFTKFRKQVEKLSEVRKTLPTPTQVNSPQLPSFTLPSLKSLGVSKPSKPTSSPALDFKGGEREAIQRLRHYLWESKALSNYKETRNGLLGSNYSSKFSPWLSMGCISTRYIYEEIQAYENQIVKNQSTYWLIFELIWRDYFRFVAHRYGNRLFHYEGIKNVSLPLKRDIGLFTKWANGETGWPFIDANMRELNQTGFMSNRGRQNVASFLVKDMRIDWRWGAAYFESKLIDYDPCSNWGNWNYVAGIGNDPREDRYFNTLSQAERYDGQGEYIKHWIPELAHIPSQYIHNPSEHSDILSEDFGFKLGKDYPKKVVDLAMGNFGSSKGKGNYKKENLHKRGRKRNPV